jgi:uncharacterized short protein YbdD (DUF466 family)
MRAKVTGRQRDSGTVLARLASMIRQISGMPDYQAYVEHARRCRADSPIMTEREYYVEYVDRRYSVGPSRCC